jgi:hypothetical protein
MKCTACMSIIALGTLVLLSSTEAGAIGGINSWTISKAQSSQNVDDSKARKPLGRKGICDESVKGTLAAVVPETGVDVVSGNSPTFLFFIPDPQTAKMNGNFRIKGNGDNIITPIRISITGTPGVIQVKVPKSDKLAPGDTFKWSFEVTCKNGEFRTVKGLINIKSPSSELSKQLEKAKTSREKAKIYHQAGYLLDAAAILAPLVKKDDQAKKDWTELLESLNLPEVIDQPVIGS